MASVQERREHFSATLSDGHNTGLLVPENFGERLAKVSFETHTNAGFSALTAQVLSSGLKEDVPLAEAQSIWRGWDRAFIQCFMDGYIVYEGHIWETSLTNYRYDPLTDIVVCEVHIACEGVYFDLTNQFAVISPAYTAVGSTVSASQLFTDFVRQLENSLFPKNVSRIQSTGINVGPLQISATDVPLDMVVNALRGASTEGPEYYFTLYELTDAAWMGPRDVGPIKWFLYAQPSTVLKKNLRNYASRLRATFTDFNNSQGLTDIADDIDAPLAHGGLVRELTISLDKTTMEAAQQARDDVLRLRTNPFAVEGQHTLAAGDEDLYPMILNPEGAHVPAWLVRAGDRVQFPDILPFDPDVQVDPELITAMVDHTSYNVDDGTMTIELDTRRANPRTNENPTVIGPSSHDTWSVRERSIVNIGPYTPIQSWPNENEWKPLDPIVEFNVPRSGEYHITIEFKFKPVVDTADGSVFYGFAIDDEQMTAEDPNTNVRQKIIQGGIAGTIWNFSHTFNRELTFGMPHKIRPMVMQTIGFNTWEVSNVKIMIFG